MNTETLVDAAEFHEKILAAHAGLETPPVQISHIMSRAELTHAFVVLDTVVGMLSTRVEFLENDHAQRVEDYVNAGHSRVVA